MDLLFRLDKPAVLRLLANLPEEVTVECMRFKGGFAPWPTSPDLVYDIETNEVLGIAAAVPHNWREMVRDAMALLDQAVVKYPSLRSASTEFDVLEILWAVSAHMDYLPAQLTEDVWYTAGDVAQETKIAAIGILNIEEMLATFGLRMPQVVTVACLDEKEKS